MCMRCAFDPSMLCGLCAMHGWFGLLAGRMRPSGPSLCFRVRYGCALCMIPACMLCCGTWHCGICCSLALVWPDWASPCSGRSACEPFAIVLGKSFLISLVLCVKKINKELKPINNYNFPKFRRGSVTTTWQKGLMAGARVN